MYSLCYDPFVLWPRIKHNFVYPPTMLSKSVMHKLNKSDTLLLTVDSVWWKLWQPTNSNIMWIHFFLLNITVCISWFCIWGVHWPEENIHWNPICLVMNIIHKLLMLGQGELNNQCTLCSDQLINCQLSSLDSKAQRNCHACIYTGPTSYNLQ